MEFSQNYINQFYGYIHIKTNVPLLAMLLGNSQSHPNSQDHQRRESAAQDQHLATLNHTSVYFLIESL
jgi:hypothetical protein